MSFASAIVYLAVGYLAGSIPTGYLLVLLMTGDDIRTYGSGNIGATNVSRVLGKRWAVFTAVVDMMKGGVAVLVATACGESDPAALSLLGFAAVLGHDFPVWLGFKGGKGVATSFGVIGCFDFFDPLPALLGGAVWFMLREATGYVSAASIAALASTALFARLLMPEGYAAVCVMMALLTAIRHKDNIKRLVAGTENRGAPMTPKIISKTMDLIVRGRR